MSSTWRTRAIRSSVLFLGPLAVAGAARALAGGAADERTAASGLLAWGLGAGILVAGIAITVAVLREHFSDMPRSAESPPTDSPPDELGPTLAAAVRCGDAIHVHAVACLFDLTARGYVQFELQDPERAKDVAAWSIRRSRTTVEHASWEQVVLAAVSAYPGESAPASTVWRALRARSSDFRTALRDELHARRDVDPGAGERRRPFHVLAVAAAVLGAAGFAVAAGLIPSIGPAALVPAVACALVAPIALAAATAVRRHTRQGALRASAVQAFRSSVRSHSRRGATLDADRFERWFAYAVAFGLTAEWIQAAKRAKLAPPTWFGGPRSAAVPFPALEAQLVAAGAIDQRSAAAGAG